MSDIIDQTLKFRLGLDEVGEFGAVLSGDYFFCGEGMFDFSQLGGEGL